MRPMLAVALLLVACTTLGAQAIDVNSSAGVFNTVLGGTNVNGVNTAALNWGVDTGSGQSGYRFATTLPPELVAVAPNNWFLLGTFQHLNNPIGGGSSITGANLDITLGLTIPSDGAGGVSNVTRTFTYVLAHDETPNGADPCAYGGANGQGVNVNGCADRVLISNPTPTQIFNVNGVDYTLKLGFSTDDGATILNEFITIEDAANRASIYGFFTTEVVPEPSFYGLLTAGLGTLFYVARRRKRI